MLCKKKLEKQTKLFTFNNLEFNGMKIWSNSQKKILTFKIQILVKTYPMINTNQVTMQIYKNQTI